MYTVFVTYVYIHNSGRLISFSNTKGFYVSQKTRKSSKWWNQHWNPSLLSSLTVSFQYITLSQQAKTYKYTLTCQLAVFDYNYKDMQQQTGSE